MPEALCLLLGTVEGAGVFVWDKDLERVLAGSSANYRSVRWSGCHLASEHSQDQWVEDTTCLPGDYPFYKVV